MIDKEIIIKVENLSKIYKLYDKPIDRLKESINPFGKKYHRDFFALRDVSFDVKRGESIGVIGKNGSGKSTLLKIITGVLTPSSGNATINGKVAALLELGTGFNPEFTGIENIYFNGTITGYIREEIDAKLDNILAFADIGDFIYQPVKTYSSGMFVRLAFAVATSVAPDVLIVDEALSVGDIFFQQKCHARMEELQNNGTVLMVVSHDMRVVEKYSTKVILLEQGGCLFLGHPNEGISRYYSLTESNRSLLDTTFLPQGNKLMQREYSSETCLDHIPDWPSENAFLDLSHAMVLGNKDTARCTRVALCNGHGQPITTFEIGEMAYFYYELEILKDIEVPLAGIEIINDINIMLYAKNAMNYMAKMPHRVCKGSHIRFRQTIELSLIHGEYSFVIDFATLSSEEYAHITELSAGQIGTRYDNIFYIKGIGKFFIREKTQGLRIPFYGYVDLKGDFKCQLL